MKTKIIIVAVVAAPMCIPYSALADSQMCELCKSLLAATERECATMCSEEEYLYTMDEVINSLPALVAQQAKTIVNAYGNLFVELYSFGYSSEQICANTGLCDGGGGGGTPCPSCTDCDSTDWTANGTGYQKRTYATCNCGVCNKTTQYRCAAGYYGSSTNGTSGCTRCPSSGGVYGTSAAGSTAITSCYIPSGTTFSDSTGSGTYTGNCYYSN